MPPTVCAAASEIVQSEMRAPMNFLFVHNNFPAQYQHIAIALARDPQIRIAAIGSSTSQQIKGVRLLRYN